MTTFEAARDSGNLTQQMAFIAALVADTSPEAAQRHFELLADRTDERFRQMLRAGFQKRGQIGGDILLQYLGRNPGGGLVADAIQLLGHLRRLDAVPVIEPYLESPDRSVRHAAVIALGWMGAQSQATLLAIRFAAELDVNVRKFIPTALRQMFLAGRCGQAELETLFAAFLNEPDDEARRLIVVSLTEITGVEFGLKENIRTGTITGDIGKAWSRVHQYFGR